MGAPPEQVAFNPRTGKTEPWAPGSRWQGERPENPKAELWSAGETEVVGLWGERYMEVEVEEVAAWLQGLGDSATMPRRNQQSSMPRLHLGTRPGVIMGAPCREVGALLQSLGQLTAVVLAWSGMATPAQGRQGTVTVEIPQAAS